MQLLWLDNTLNLQAEVEEYQPLESERRFRG